MQKRDIDYLYSRTVSRIFSTPESLIPFLHSSAWLYKYSFENQVLIHAQIQNPTAVATFNQWNNLGRSINRGASGCYRYSSDGRGYHKDLFDVSDTNGSQSTAPKLWGTGTQKQDAAYFPSSDDIEKWCYDTADAVITSFPEEIQQPAGAAKYLIDNAVQYIVSTRLGLPNETCRDNIFLLYGRDDLLAKKSVNDIIVVGKAISKSSTQVLREIERRIKNEQYNREAYAAAGIQGDKRPDIQAEQGTGSVLSGYRGRRTAGNVRGDAQQGATRAQRLEVFATGGELQALGVPEGEQRDLLSDSGELHGQRDRAGAGRFRRKGKMEPEALGEGARVGDGGTKPQDNVSIFGRIAKSLKIVKEQAAEEESRQMSLGDFSFSAVNLPGENDSPTLKDILSNFEPDTALDSVEPEIEKTAGSSETTESAVQEDSVFALSPNDAESAKPKTENKKAAPQTELSEKINFRYPDEPDAGDFETGAKARYRDNIAAVQTLNNVESELRAATLEEQAILAKYAGWGGLSEAFDLNNQAWGNEYRELIDLLPDADYTTARASTTTSFYTPLPVIRAIYSALESFGLSDDARILEPSAGTGRFFGALPPSLSGAKLYGVELDSISARIASKLYPSATIRQGGFENAQFSDNQFDGAVGNVPFGNYQLADPRYDKHHLLIHDYFFAKALDKVRPGGIVAFVTSTGTMDKADTRVREYLARRADLIGAIRLPNDTFKSAGTQTDADIIILQKRDLLRDMDESPDWIHTEENKDGFIINRYFAEHPEMVLGQMKSVTGRFGESIVCSPFPNQKLSELLNAAVSSLNATIPDYEHVLADEALPAPPEVKNFTYTQVDGSIYYREHGLLIPQNLKQAEASRVAAMDNIRITARRLIDLQPTYGAELEIEELRSLLNKYYDDFSIQFGKLHDRVNERLFSKDVDVNFLKALEQKQQDGSYGKTDIFYRRTVSPQKVFNQAESAVDAMYMSLNMHGSVNIGTIMSLYPKSFDDVVSELGDVVYQNPAKWDGDILQGWETREEYLSGNVRKKLKEAESAFSENPERFERNVAVLKENQPEWIEAGQIEARPGASWLGKDYLNQFIWETFDTPFWIRSDMNQGIHVEYNPHTSEWSVQNAAKDSGIKAREIFGTKRANAYSLFEDTLNLKDTTIRDRIDDKVYVVNQKETQLARAKQTQIKNAFQSWLFADSTRRHILVDKYNNLFNSVRHRNYDGGHLDEWVADFAETTTSLELAVEGSGFRQRTRLSKYFNLPELMQLYRQVADVQTADMLQLPRPAIRGGEPTIVLCEPSEDLLYWVQDGVGRCKKIRNREVKPEEDNMFKFTLEAKLAGLDMRLVNPYSDFDPNGKIAMCAKNIIEVHSETQAENGVQIVFCDSSTPNPKHFNVYSELKRILTERGISTSEIAFIHDAKNDKAKEELFDKCRKGEIRVLIGSTEKCGAGTNIQTRLAALHHIDCPYRPRDIAQREGRIIRQGNMFREVSIFRYVTEKSFDAYLWNIVATKQRFISQIRQSSSSQRSFEDKDETLLSFEAVQAIATGNPLIMEKINLDNRISQLQLLLAEYNNQRYRLQDQIEVQLPAKREKISHLIQNLSEDCSTVKSHPSDDFVMTVGGKVYSGRDDAGNALIELSRTVEPNGSLVAGEYKGLSVELVHEQRSNTIMVRLKGAGIHLTELNETSGVGTSTRIDNLVKELPMKRERAAAELEQLETSLSSAIEELARPYEFAEELAKGIERQAELNAQLNLEDKPNEENTEENENIDGQEQDESELQDGGLPRRTRMADYELEHPEEMYL